MVGLSAIMWLCPSYFAKLYLSALAGPACVQLSYVSQCMAATYRYHP